MKTLKDNSVDLIVTDPPYFRVKKDSWNNQWKTEVDFLAWLDEVFFQYYRVLKPAGSIYVFCGDKLSAKQKFYLDSALIF